MIDIESNNPEYAKQLMKQYGTKGAIRQLKKFLDGNDKHYQEMKETILNQMEKASDPLERMQQENQAHEIALEMANEEVKALYTPPPEEPMTEVQGFLKMLRM